jgi:hypothetical protein
VVSGSQTREALAPAYVRTSSAVAEDRDPTAAVLARRLLAGI